MKLRWSASLLIVMIAAGSGRLLVCQWDCAGSMAAAPVSSCHEASDAAGVSMTALAQDCEPDAVIPGMTTIKVAATNTVTAIGAIAPPSAPGLPRTTRFDRHTTPQSSVFLALSTVVLRI